MTDPRPRPDANARPAIPDRHREPGAGPGASTRPRGRVEVLADLVVQMTPTMQVLIASVDDHSPALNALLDAVRAGASSTPTGRSHWVPRWSDQHLDAIELHTQLRVQPPLDLTVCFTLPDRTATLARQPSWVAITNPAGFRALQRSHHLPWGVLLPDAPAEMLAELLPTR